MLRNRADARLHGCIEVSGADFGRSHARDEDDGGLRRILFRLVQAVFAFRLYWPSCRNGETGLDQRSEQRLPCLLFLMGEHHGKNAFVPEHTACLNEHLRHQLLVMLLSKSGGLLRTYFAGAEPRIILDGFLGMLAKQAGKPLGPPIALTALQPDIKEVR